LTHAADPGFEPASETFRASIDDMLDAPAESPKQSDAGSSMPALTATPLSGCTRS